MVDWSNRSKRTARKILQTRILVSWRFISAHKADCAPLSPSCCWSSLSRCWSSPSRYRSSLSRCRSSPSRCWSSLSRCWSSPSHYRSSPSRRWSSMSRCRFQPEPLPVQPELLPVQPMWPASAMTSLGSEPSAGRAGLRSQWRHTAVRAECKQIAWCRYLLYTALPQLPRHRPATVSQPTKPCSGRRRESSEARNSLASKLLFGF